MGVRMCGTQELGLEERVAFPVNGYNPQYVAKLVEDEETGQCSFGRQRLEGPWDTPILTTDGYYVVANQVITPESEPEVVERALMIVSERHQYSASDLTLAAFAARGRLLVELTKMYGSPTAYGERFGDELSGKTIAHEHAQVLWLKKPRSFVIGTYRGELKSGTIEETPKTCQICPLIKSGISVIASAGSQVLLGRLPRRALNQEKVEREYWIVPRDHRPPQSLVVEDFVDRGILFQELLNRGVTGGGILEHWSGGPNAHAALQVVVPKRRESGQGAAVLFIMGGLVERL